MLFDERFTFNFIFNMFHRVLKNNSSFPHDILADQTFGFAITVLFDNRSSRGRVVKAMD